MLATTAELPMHADRGAPAAGAPASTDSPPVAAAPAAASLDIESAAVWAAVWAARRGDRAAFARLQQRFEPMVHAIALARVPHADAPDLVQETFLHAMEHLSLLRDDRAFGAWLATITRNLAVEFHRRRRVRLHQELDDQATAPAQARGATERALRLLEVIRMLPEAYAETLVLRPVEGLTGPQIAACTGKTHGSVRVNLTRGMQMLRERLSELKLDPEDSS